LLIISCAFAFSISFTPLLYQLIYIVYQTSLGIVNTFFQKIAKKITFFTIFLSISTTFLYSKIKSKYFDKYPILKEKIIKDTIRPTRTKIRTKIFYAIDL
jgi:hypothetical protein